MKYSIFLTLLLLINNQFLCMEPNAKRQRTNQVSNKRLYNAFCDSNFKAMQQALDEGAHLNFKIYFALKLLVVEIFTIKENATQQTHELFKTPILYSPECNLTQQIKYLLLNGVNIQLESIDQEDLTWDMLLPEIAALLLHNSTDHKSDIEKSTEYQKNSEYVCDPVKTFPKAFADARRLQDNYYKEKIKIKNGSVANYLRLRELGKI